MYTSPTPPNNDFRDLHFSQPNYANGSFIDFERLFSAFRRQSRGVFLSVLIAAILGFVYILSVQPRYTADALVLIDNNRVSAVEKDYGVSTTNMDVAASVVDSQVELVKSEKIAELVVRRLNLLNDPEVVGNAQTREGQFQRLRRTLHGYLFGSSTQSAAPAADTPDTLLRRAADTLRYGMDVFRVGRTMVLQVSYTSTSPAKAARIANAYAEAYLANQFDAKYEATKRASDWLDGRIVALKQKVLESDREVQKFKEDNKLVTTGGRLVNEQQMNELNTQHVLARAETAKAEARYQRIKSIIDKHQTDAIVSEAIGNKNIEILRGKYLDASKRQSEIASKLGPDHLQAINLRNEMGQYDRLMFEELGRIAESYKSEVDIAKSKQVSLSSDLDQLVSQNTNENNLLVPLRELERQGEAYRNLYRNYLERYQEALQQQSFPIIEARIITNAALPAAPSYPKKSILMLLFIFTGAAIGTAIGILREFRERGYQNEDQVRDDLNLPCIGFLPRVNPKGAAAKTIYQRFRSRGGTADSTVPASPPIMPRSRSSSPIMSYVLDRPASGFAETLLAAKLAIDIRLSGHPSKIIGIVSALPDEGKTVVSKNFASLLATLNLKTLLIDADLRGPELSRRIAPGATSGIIEAALNKTPLSELVMMEEQSGLAILPAVIKTRMPHSSEFLGSQGMRDLLAQASKQYDYVVVDLPPIGPVVDAKALSAVIQAFIMVTEWRLTARKVVRTIFSNDAVLHSKCVGVILNKVNIGDLKRYENYGSRYYYYKKYLKSYYIES